LARRARPAKESRGAIHRFAALNAELLANGRALRPPEAQRAEGAEGEVEGPPRAEQVDAWIRGHGERRGDRARAARRVAERLARGDLVHAGVRLGEAARLNIEARAGAERRTALVSVSLCQVSGRNDVEPPRAGARRGGRRERIDRMGARTHVSVGEAAEEARREVAGLVHGLDLVGQHGLLFRHDGVVRAGKSRVRGDRFGGASRSVSSGRRRSPFSAKRGFLKVQMNVLKIRRLFKRFGTHVLGRIEFSPNYSWGTLRLQFGGAEKCSLGGFAIGPLRL